MKKRAYTYEQVLRAVESNELDCTTIGICIACGSEQDGCEPDACEYTCESCGENKVFGAEEILMMLI